MPPAVPVVITHFGLQSSMICSHTVRLGVVSRSRAPSCEKCESDLNRVTFRSPTVAAQYVPSRW